MAVTHNNGRGDRIAELSTQNANLREQLADAQRWKKAGEWLEKRLKAVPKNKPLNVTKIHSDTGEVWFSPEQELSDEEYETLLEAIEALMKEVDGE